MNKSILSLSALLASVSLISCGPVGPPRDSAATTSPVSLPQGKSTGLTRAEGQPLYGLEWVGEVETPLIKQPVQVSAGSQIRFSGWAVDEQQKAPAGAVDVTIDGKPYASEYGGERPDVANYVKWPSCKNSAFSLFVPGGAVPRGRHVVTIRVLSKNGKIYWEGVPITFDVK